MKILIMGWWGGDHPGPNSCLIRLARPFIHLGHEVDALSVTSRADVPLDLGIHSVFVGKSGLGGSIVETVKLLKNYDLVYSWAVNRYFAGFSLLRLARRSPKVWLDINVDTFDKVGTLNAVGWKFFADCANLLTVPSKSYINYLEDRWKFKRERMHHLFYSVDPRLFEGDKAAARALVLQQFNLSEEEPITVHTGRVDKFQLGIYLQLLKADICNVIILGPDLIDPAIKEIISHLEKSYPNKFKTSKGFLLFNELIPYLLASDFFIVHYPDNFLGHPQKIYDYIASRTPIIINDFPGVSDLVPPEIAIKLKNPSIDMYVEAIKETLNSDLSKTLSNNCKQFSENNLLVPMVAQKVQELLKLNFPV